MSQQIVRGLSAAIAAFALLSGAPAARADAQQEIHAAFEAMVKAGKFRTTGTTDAPRGGPQKNTVEVVWPDRFHMTSEQTEVIIVPGSTYMKQGGKWQQLPVDMSRMIERFKPQAMKEAFVNTSNVKAIGDSTVNGHAVRGYEYDTTVKVAGVTASSHAKLWVDKDTGLPTRMESDGEAMGHKSHNVNDYEFDAGIRVEAPM